MTSDEEHEPLLYEESSRSVHDESFVEYRNSRQKSFPVLEPAVLLLLFALNLSGVVFQNQVVYQVCTAVYKYNDDECSKLGTGRGTNQSQRIEAQIQPYAANIFMVQIILENVVPALGSLLIGPWSDKFGRKPVIVAAFIGFSTKYVLFALIAFLSTKTLINPWFYISAVVPEIILGGNSSFSIGCICYLRDTTNVRERPFRMVSYESCIYIGLLAGSFCSSYIFLATNSIIVLTITGFTTLFLTVYIILFLRESLEISQQRAVSNFFNIFQFAHIRDALRTCFKKRPVYDRAIILLILSTMGFYNIVIRGSGTVFFLFVRMKFDWTVKDFTTFESTGLVAQIVGSVFGMIVLRKIIGLSTLSLALIAYCSATLDETTRAASSHSWHLYLSLGLGVLKTVGTPMCFTILSSVVSSHDAGKIFSLANVLQSFLTLGSAPLYTFIYDKTLALYPGAFLILSTGLFFICFILISQRIIPAGNVVNDYEVNNASLLTVYSMCQQYIPNEHVHIVSGGSS